MMPTVLYILSGLEIVSGLGVLGAAGSAIHQVLGTLMVGFGVMTIALAAILAELRKPTAR